MSQKIQYRVRPVTRFIVTRADWTEHEDGTESSGSSTQHGEFGNFETAYEVGYALCKAEHDRLGYPPGDERIAYPDPAPPTDKLSQARLYRKMADSLQADDAKERLQRERPDLLKTRPSAAPDEA